MDARYTELDAEKFLSTFFPTQKPIDARNREALADLGREIKVPAVGGKDEELYKPLCDVFQNLLTCLRLSPYAMKMTAHDPESSEHGLKPDLCLYKVPVNETMLLTCDMASHCRGKCLWSRVVAAFENKVTADAMSSNSEDRAFTMNVNPKAGFAGPKACARMGNYATEIRNHQPSRRFAFTAFIKRDQVRFMLWDANGAIVSKAVNWHEDPYHLFDSIHQLAIADPSTQGRIYTIELTSRHDVVFDIRAMRTELYRVLASPDLPESAISARWKGVYLGRLEKPDLNPLYQITVPTAEDDTTSRTSVIGAYLDTSTSPTRRCTRVHPAFDLEELKLYWWAEGEDIILETRTAIYKTLHHNGVRNIPRLLAGGPIRERGNTTEEVGGSVGRENARRQYTLTERFLPSNKCPKRRYLLCTENFGCPSKYFETQKVLYDALMDALEAHRAAYAAGVAHRDVSANNILIDIDTGRAFLNDWDLAKYIGNMNQGGSQPGRSGTWMYMSGASLRWPLKPWTVSDDLESFVHVVTVMGLRYFEHDYTVLRRDFKNLKEPMTAGEVDLRASFASHVSQLYSERWIFRGQWRGGIVKTGAMLSGGINIGFANPTDPIPALIEGAYQAFQPYYRAINNKEWDAHYNPRPYSESSNPPPTFPQSTLKALDGITHDFLTEVFTSSVADTDFSTAAQKTDDQFRDLPDHYGGTSVKGFSGSTRDLEEDVPPGGPNPKRSKAY